MSFAIVAMILGFTLIVVKMGLDYSRAQLEALPEAPPDATLLVSELEEMISGAIAEAVRPLEHRIEELETLRLPSASSDGPARTLGNIEDHSQSAGS
jgi:hypothetical protein